MFSTDATPAASTRGSRRRQRTSGDSVAAQPKAKRVRRTINDPDVFIPPADPNPVAVARPSQTAVARREPPIEAPTSRQQLAVRGKKSKVADRSNKGDGSVLLTANSTYIVSKLPAWPDRLREDPQGRQHGAIYSDLGYGLTITHTHAIVWPYDVNLSSPETFAFALPQPLRHATDPLPLGSLVSPSASSSEPGLVIVMPTTGKITYWESIASAATLDLIRQQRNGVEATVSGMLSGETIISILNAESAGFVLGFSSGRVAYMAVRDNQGRPNISIEFLSGTGSKGRLFASFRIMANPIRGDLAAIRAGNSTHIGERDVVVATTKGKLQLWNLNRGGQSQNTSQAEAEGREPIVLAIKHTQPALSSLPADSFEVLDFVFVPSVIDKNSQLADLSKSEQDEKAVNLLLLTSLTDRTMAHYNLVQVVFSKEGLEVQSVRPLKRYTTPRSHIATSKPRLYLPNPALVAYAVFDRSVVVASMARSEDSPDAQLSRESLMTPRAFEDVVDLRESANVEVVGTGVEDPQGPITAHNKKKSPAAVLLVRGGGVIRVAFTSSRPSEVTAKSKLEQAVFFGSLQHNPLSFTGRPELQFTPEEYADAALKLSHEILSSSSKYLPALAPSIDENLHKRADYLGYLITHLNAMKIQLDRVTRWKLLWGAEKLAAATAAWKTYDAQVRQKPKGKKRGIIADIVEHIHEDHKSEPAKEDGELDRVRHWFIKDIWRLEIAIPWAQQVVRILRKEGELDQPEVFCAYVNEANSFVLDTIDEAFKFRQANLELYRLGDEVLMLGVMIEGYADMPEIWTSTFYMTESLKRQLELAMDALTKYGEKPAEEQPDPGLISKIRSDAPKLVDLACRSYLERVRWCMAAADELTQNHGKDLWSTYQDDRDAWILGLADLHLPEEARELGEQYRTYKMLVAIVWGEIKEIEEDFRLLGSLATSEELKAKRERYDTLHGHVNRYFDTYKQPWAFAFYNYFISNGLNGSLLDEARTHPDFVKKYLRSRDEFSKLAWINAVLDEGDFETAARDLIGKASNREQDEWSKKVELSVGKLALLAAKESSDNKAIMPLEKPLELEDSNKRLALMHIQDQIYLHVRPAVSAAIDEEAELDVALSEENFGNQHLEGLKALKTLLRENMVKLLSNTAMDAISLIDLLTLMGPGRSESGENISGIETALALKALSTGLQNKDDEPLVERVIWRRCFIRDDWSEINNTDMKDDQQIRDQITRTALYSTLSACFKERLFEAPSNLKPLKPSEAHGAGTQSLDSRYSSLDQSVIEAVMKDMEAEDQILQSYIKKHRLDMWFEQTLNMAKRDVEAEMNEVTATGQKMLKAAEELQKIEMAIKKPDEKESNGKEVVLKKAQVNGHARAGLRSSVRVQ